MASIGRSRSAAAVALAAGLGSAALVPSAPAAAAPVTLCRGAETVVFSCRTGARIVSVCASGDFDHGHGLMQYRYGQPGRLELVYPDRPSEPHGLFKSGTLTFSGGGGAYLSFGVSGVTDVTYTVFTAIGNWGKTGKGTADGVAITIGGKPAANKPCRQDADLVRGELGPDFFEKAKLGEPEHDFEIPDAFMK